MTPRVHSWGCLGFKTLLPQLTQVWNNRPVSPLPPCSGSLKAQHIAWSLFDSPWLLSHWMWMAARGGSLYWGILAEHWILVTFLFSCFSTTLLLWKKHWRNTNTMIHIKSFFFFYFFGDFSRFLPGSDCCFSPPTFFLYLRDFKAVIWACFNFL